MGSYSVKTNTDRDAEGMITRSGAVWAETRPFTENALTMMVIVSAFAVVGGIVWAVAAGFNMMLGLGLLGLGVATPLLFMSGGTPRALYFHQDGGRMQTPFGLPHDETLPAIGGRHENIVSIESRPQREQPQSKDAQRLYEVVIVFESGDMVCLSRNLLEWIALKAAVQLTQMLGEMRREEASIEFA